MRVVGTLSVIAAHERHLDSRFVLSRYITPQINITLGGMDVIIPEEVFTLGQVAEHSMYCLGGIQATTLSQWVFGDVFMRNVYSAFDAAQKRVGFAKLA